MSRKTEKSLIAEGYERDPHDDDTYWKVIRRADELHLTSASTEADGVTVASAFFPSAQRVAFWARLHDAAASAGSETPRFSTEKRPLCAGWTLYDGRQPNSHGANIGEIADEFDAKALVELLNGLHERASRSSTSPTNSGAPAASQQAQQHDDEPDLWAIQARCDAASVGPWFASDTEVLQGDEAEDSPELPEPLFMLMDHADLADAEFIAHARQDIPDLINYIMRLRQPKAIAAQPPTSARAGGAVTREWLRSEILLLSVGGRAGMAVSAAIDALLDRVFASRVSGEGADAERLDWLASQWTKGVHLEICGANRGGNAESRFAVTLYVGNQEWRGTNVDEVIDTARRSRPARSDV